MLKHYKKIVTVAALVGVSLVSEIASAGEVEIGEAVERHGMEIGAVYLQAVMMEPDHPGMSATDIHLEADISALKGNAHGFEEGQWIPYLGITYYIRKEGGDWSTLGAFAPMVASDGPHYGANVKLNGPGKYHLSYRINPPSYQGFLRHKDKETGVDVWWNPIDVSWEFTYLGTGKKGGY